MVNILQVIGLVVWRVISWPGDYFDNPSNTFSYDHEFLQNLPATKLRLFTFTETCHYWQASPNAWAGAAGENKPPS